MDKINLNVIHGRAYVWNSDDVIKLRSNYKIVGVLMGCLPRAPYQNSHLGLPLQLLPEEVTLLLEKKYAKVSEVKFGKSWSESKKHLYEEGAEKIYSEQVDLFKEGRRAQILAMADQIIEGKRRKLLKQQQKRMDQEALPNTNEQSQVETERHSTGNEMEIDRDALLQVELEKIIPLPRDKCLTHLSTACPLVNGEDEESVEWNFPSTEQETLRYRIFKDLWGKGYYLTCGQKFGGDFLVYAGDPVKYHALFIVICKSYSKPLHSLDLILLSRLGTQVKKTVMLATVKPDATICYLSMWWRGHWNLDLNENS